MRVLVHAYGIITLRALVRCQRGCRRTLASAQARPAAAPADSSRRPARLAGPHPPPLRTTELPLRPRPRPSPVVAHLHGGREKTCGMDSRRMGGADPPFG